jgi:hypothetical protein
MGDRRIAGLVKDRLYICNDNQESSYLLALDKKSGDEIWRVPREEKSNWSTPFVWENGQRTEIITTGSGGVRSYDLEGKQLWSLKGMSSITIATPYAVNGLLYISSGHVGDKKRPIYAIKPGATGDISLAEGQTSNQWIAWSAPQGCALQPVNARVQRPALRGVRHGRLCVLQRSRWRGCLGAEAHAGYRHVYGIAMGVQRQGLLPQ